MIEGVYKIGFDSEAQKVAFESFLLSIGYLYPKD